jgi:hypothetical protein
MKIHTSLDVDVPAAEAWRLLADGFGDISEWTTAVDGSRLVGDRVGVGSERHCQISGPGSGDGLAVERITAFDPDAMTYSYEAVRGLPRFLRSGGTAVAVIRTGERRCRVDLDGRVAVPWPILPLWPLLRTGLRVGVRRFVRDLRYRLENGTPHPDVTAARVR